MTSARDLFQQTKKWQRKVALVSFVHNKMLITKRGHWTIKNTAKYFNISVGLVSENLQLAKQLDKCKNCNNRKEALDKIKQ